MRVPSSLALLCAAALLASCGGESSSRQVPPPAPATPASATPAGDFPLGQEWVKTMLDENDQTIASMREELDRIRRELDRLEASPASANQEALKQSMLDALDRQENNLRKLNDQTGEMRKVLAAPSP